MSVCNCHEHPKELLDDHRALEPPDPIPNSVVKRRIADGSVEFLHVRVGHRQAPIPKPRSASLSGALPISVSTQFVLAADESYGSPKPSD